MDEARTGPVVTLRRLRLFGQKAATGGEFFTRRTAREDVFVSGRNEAALVGVRRRREVLRQPEREGATAFLGESAVHQRECLLRNDGLGAAIAFGRVRRVEQFAELAR